MPKLNLLTKLLDNLYLIIYPVLGYTAAFFYKSTYLGHYGISETFIQISTPDIIHSLYYISIIIVPLVILSSVLKRAIGNITLNYLATLFISLFLACYTYLTEGFSISTIVLYLPLILFASLLLLIAFSPQRFDRIMKVPPPFGSLINELVTDHRAITYFLTNLSFATVLLAVIAGKISAATQEVFYIYPEKERSFVIVGAYNGQLQGVRLDMNTKKLHPEYLFINTENASISKLKLGRLDNELVRKIH